ncbi:MAG: aspartate ammonia-lyase [Bacilli bacterium]
MRFRIEKDDLGERQVPAEAYYGIQTLRSRENFQISKRPISRQMIKGLATVKKAAAKANYDAGYISKDVCNAIGLACDEILNGRLHGQFITDLVQGGAGTSMNMNANEVIANRANEMLGSEKGKYDKVHPINHVNFCQSANDVVPTAGKIATYRLSKKLIVEMKKLVNAYYDKAKEYENVITISKTHLLDSVPMTFGQLFNALASSVERDIKKIEYAMSSLLEINIGGTVIGTGLNADTTYYKKVAKYISQYTGENFKQAKNMVDATRHLDAFAWLSSAIKTFALNINKHATDLRLMDAVFNSIILPKVQPGSTINPGKINPVIPEMIHQVVLYMQGNDLTICNAVANGDMELNVNLPIILACLFENINFIRRAVRTLREKAIEGLVVIEKKDKIIESDSIITALLPVLGYDVCSEVTTKANEENKSVIDVVLELGLLSKEKAEEIFTHEKIISKGIINITSSEDDEE